jgi:hypothetical protein
MKFRQWLESEEKNFDFYRNVILNYLGLHSEKGLSQSLDTFNKDNLKQKLQSLGEFSALPNDIQNNVIARIDGTQGGTVGDLIRLMAYRREAA